MRQIEKEIVRAMRELRNTGKERRLSERDFVSDNERGTFYRLHGTVVANHNRDGSIQTWTGGWESNTTKSRLNAILDSFNCPYGIYQKNWVWYWNAEDKDGKPREYRAGDKVECKGDGWEIISSVM